MTNARVSVTGKRISQVVIVHLSTLFDVAEGERAYNFRVKRFSSPMLRAAEDAPAAQPGRGSWLASSIDFWACSPSI